MDKEKIKRMALQGLKAQLMRADRDFKTCWKIALDIAEKIARECERKENDHA